MTQEHDLGGIRILTGADDRQIVRAHKLAAAEGAKVFVRSVERSAAFVLGPAAASGLGKALQRSFAGTAIGMAAAKARGGALALTAPLTATESYVRGRAAMSAGAGAAAGRGVAGMAAGLGPAGLAVGAAAALAASFLALGKATKGLIDKFESDSRKLSNIDPVLAGVQMRKAMAELTSDLQRAHALRPQLVTMESSLIRVRDHLNQFGIALDRVKLSFVNAVLPSVEAFTRALPKSPVGVLFASPVGPGQLVFLAKLIYEQVRQLNGSATAEAVRKELEIDWRNQMGFIGDINAFRGQGDPLIDVTPPPQSSPVPGRNGSPGGNIWERGHPFGPGY